MSVSAKACSSTLCNPPPVILAPTDKQLCGIHFQGHASLENVRSRQCSFERESVLICFRFAHFLFLCCGRPGELRSPCVCFVSMNNEFCASDSGGPFKTDVPNKQDEVDCFSKLKTGALIFKLIRTTNAFDLWAHDRYWCHFGASISTFLNRHINLIENGS